MDKPLIQSNSVLAVDLLNLIGQNYLQALSDELGADKCDLGPKKLDSEQVRDIRAILIT